MSWANSELEAEMADYVRLGGRLYQEGHRAGVSGRPESATPYPAGHWKHDAWYQGWIDGHGARRQREFIAINL